MERLAKHPEVGGYGELLLRGVEGWSNWPKGAADRPFYTTYMKELGLETSRVAAHARVFRYLDYVYEPRRGFRAIGFKLMYGHVARFPGTLAYLRVHDVKVIHLIRTNLLDLLLSRQAVQHRSWHHTRTDAERETVRVEVDTGHLVTELNRLRSEQRAARAALRALRLPVQTITYESLRVNDLTFQKTLAFIGASPPAGMDLSPIMQKQAPNSQRETVTNFDQVAAVLSGTRYEVLLRP